MKPVTLRTGRLMLSSLTENDLQRLWENGYKNGAMWVHFKRRVETYSQFRLSYMRKMAASLKMEGDAMAWCIRDIRTEKPYGMIDVHDDWEMSWSIASEYQGNGYCVEAAAAVLYYLFCKRDADYAMVKISSSDLPSLKVAETLGFKLGSTGFMVNSAGNIVKLSYFVLLKEDFLNKER